MRSGLMPFIVFITAVAAVTIAVALVVPPITGVVVGHNTTIIEDNGITTENLIVNADLTVGGIVTGDLTMNVGKLVDGLDVGSHRHSGGPGDGSKLDGDNCLKGENLNLGTGLLATTHTITRRAIIPSSNLGRPPTNPPTVAIYGICHVLEFTVNTDKAYYKFHVPEDWVSETGILMYVYWTRSSTGSDNTKTVKWQVKYLVVDGVSHNVNAGESTLSVQDTYDSTSTTDQIVYQTDNVAVPASSLSLGNCGVIELMAITSTGTALSEPACAAMMIEYTAYQVPPA